MATVDNTSIKDAEAAFADAIAKLKDRAAAGTANADVVASLNEQIAALTADLVASQAESTDLGAKLAAQASDLAALVAPAA